MTVEQNQVLIGFAPTNVEAGVEVIACDDARKELHDANDVRLTHARDALHRGCANGHRSDVRLRYERFRIAGQGVDADGGEKLCFALEDDVDPNGIARAHEKVALRQPVSEKADAQRRRTGRDAVEGEVPVGSRGRGTWTPDERDRGVMNRESGGGGIGARGDTASHDAGGDILGGEHSGEKPDQHDDCGPPHCSFLIASP